MQTDQPIYRFLAVKYPDDIGVYIYIYGEVDGRFKQLNKPVLIYSDEIYEKGENHFCIKLIEKEINQQILIHGEKYDYEKINDQIL